MRISTHPVGGPHLHIPQIKQTKGFLSHYSNCSREAAGPCATTVVCIYEGHGSGGPQVFCVCMCRLHRRTDRRDLLHWALPWLLEVPNNSLQASFPLSPCPCNVPLLSCPHESGNLALLYLHLPAASNFTFKLVLRLCGFTWTCFGDSVISPRPPSRMLENLGIESPPPTNVGAKL